MKTDLFYKISNKYKREKLHAFSVCVQYIFVYDMNFSEIL